VVGAADGLTRGADGQFDPDRQVGEAVVVEVAGQPTGRPVQHVHRAGGNDAASALERHADGQVVGTVVVEVGPHLHGS
jgi:hypothetical protein